MILLIAPLVLLSFFIPANCTVYKAAHFGGDGGREVDDNDLVQLQSGNYHLSTITLWGSDTRGLQGIQGRYTIANNASQGDPQITNGNIIGHSSGDVKHIEINKEDIVERAYSYYVANTAVFSGTYITQFFGFDIRRANGSLDQISTGQQEGAYFTILGPIVGFYGREGGAVDTVGVYVDPSLWPNRPSQLVMLSAGGKSLGNGNEHSFDHNIELGEPFTVRIVLLVIYYNTQGIKGLHAVYEDPLNNTTPIITGSTVGDNVTVALKTGDFIKSLQVNDDDSSGDCVKGMKLIVFRASNNTDEEFSAADASSDLLTSSGPIVAFHGLMENTTVTCIARIGGYKLFDNPQPTIPCALPVAPTNGRFCDIAEFLVDNVTIEAACNKGYTLTGGENLTCVNGVWEGVQPQCTRIQTCDLPKLPNYAQLDYIPEQSGIYQLLTVSCRNTSLVAVKGTKLICRENGAWEGEELECKVPCALPVAPTNGRFCDIAEFLVDNVTIEAACNKGYTLTGGENLTCVNGVWEGDQPQCTHGMAARKSAASRPVLSSGAIGGAVVCAIFLILLMLLASYGLGIATVVFLKRKQAQTQNSKEAVEEVKGDDRYIETVEMHFEK